MVRVYDSLRAAAARQLRGEPRGTLEPAAIVHEVYLRMVRRRRSPWQSEDQFRALAVTEMRRVLIDAARRRRARKRGGGRGAVALDESIHVAVPPDVATLDVDRMLCKLARTHPRSALVAELTFRRGLADREIAAALGVSDRTVRSDRRFARRWLRRRLGR